MYINWHHATCQSTNSLTNKRIKICKYITARGCIIQLIFLKTLYKYPRQAKRRSDIVCNGVMSINQSQDSLLLNINKLVVQLAQWLVHTPLTNGAWVQFPVWLEVTKPDKWGFLLALRFPPTTQDYIVAKEQANESDCQINLVWTKYYNNLATSHLPCIRYIF